MNGVQTRFYYDDADDKATIATYQDIEPCLEQNQRDRNASSTHFDRHRAMHHAARIPLVIIEKYRAEKGIDLMNDPDAMRKFLNDPDNKIFRTRGGKV